MVRRFFRRRQGWCTILGIPKKSAPIVTEAEVCRYLGKDLLHLKEIAKEKICREIDALTSDELFDVFWAGRKQYGGEFDVEAIPCVREIRKEAADTVWYTVFSLLQSDH